MPLPPGPRAPALLQTRAWMRESYPFLDRCEARFGDTFTVRFAGFGRAVFTSRPSAIHDIFTADADTLLAGKGNDVLLPFLGKHSLLTLDGRPHLRDRKLMIPSFHGQRMRAYGHIIREAALRASAGWRAGDEVALHPVMQGVSMEVILRAVFGVGEGAELARAERIITALLAATTPALLFLAPLRVDLGPKSPWGRYRRRHAEANGLLLAEIARRRADPALRGQDILSLLLDVRDEQGRPLSDEELLGELVTLLVAGHETTATGLAWAFRWVLSDPAVRDRLLAEIAGVDDPDALAKLPWLGAVCSEALRVLPVFPIVMRVVAKPFRLLDWELQPGDRVAPCVYLTHRRPDLYPDADRFRPERFLERSFSPVEYIPFGGGNRRCLGAAFATYEMKIVLATVLSRFRLDAVEPGAPVAKRTHLALAPSDGARVRVREVLSHAA